VNFGTHAQMNVAVKETGRGVDSSGLALRSVMGYCEGDIGPSGSVVKPSMENC
jgi:hypothetical protein